MNFGDCPYEGCLGVLMVGVPQRTPAYARIDCPECKRVVWYRMSRIDPMAWTVADFEAEYVVDYESKKIEKRK